MPALQRLASRQVFEPQAVNERQCPRYRLLLGVQGRLPDSTWTEVVIHNLSATGLLLGVETPLTIGSEIVISLPNSGEMVAEVVRVEGKLVGSAFRGRLSPASLQAVLAASPVVWLPDGGTIGDRRSGPTRARRWLKLHGRALIGSPILFWLITIAAALAMIRI